MKSRNVQHLYQNLKRKGISIDRGDIKYLRNYSYYQIINAYKPLFLVGIKSIEDIRTDIFNGKQVDEYLRIFNKESFKEDGFTVIYHEICKKICESYVGNHKNLPTSELEKLIKKKKYILHLYDKETKLYDFVRLYQFEHSLRNLLLKYILRIEEDIKTIFCSTLNDKKLDSNFLFDINNYNVSDDSSIRTLVRIIKKQHNKHSNPISRKKSQNIIPPFWILINELTLGELRYTISSLKSEYRTSILNNLIMHFTNQTKPNGKSRNAMLNLLSDISGFRNDLAHNNPIFQYNISGHCLKNHPILTYTKPKIKDIDSLEPSQVTFQKNNRKLQIQSDLVKFWGSDQYNSQSVKSFNINLSYIIYLLYKFTSKIDPSTKYTQNVQRIFTKYKIIGLGSWGTCENFEQHEKNLSSLKDINKKLDGLNKTTYRSLESKKQFKEVISKMKSEISLIKSGIVEILRTDSIISDSTKDTNFPFVDVYTRYTGIDSNYLTNYLN